MRRLPVLLSVMTAMLLAGCGERIVFRDRDLLVDLPAGSGGFVGYSDVEAGVTVCGNCHVTQQNQWEGNGARQRIRRGREHGAPAGPGVRGVSRCFPHRQ
jgi:hypothetical protein